VATPPIIGVKAERPTGRNLFQGLFDDAAVFPPELAPLPQAVTDHVARQSSSYADMVGPLLLPASAIGDLLSLELPPLKVALIGRPGTQLALVAGRLSRLVTRPAVTVIGVEIGWSPAWLQAAGWGMSCSIEVPRGAELQSALLDIQAHADDPNLVQAKFRTGSTPHRTGPTSRELAIFIRSCVDRDLSFKLTDGLHRATSYTTSSGEDHFGFLNVIAATRWALAHGAEIPEMGFILSEHDPAPILDIITRMSEADASVVRAFFTSYSCCRVTDPISDLFALGLIKEAEV